MKNDLRDVAGRLLFIRKHLKMNRSVFADLAGTTPEKISQWENGLEVPTVEELQQISKHSKVNEEIILYGHFAEVFFDPSLARIPVEYHPFARHMEFTDFKEVYDYVQSHNISMKDTETINEIIIQLMEKTYHTVTKTGRWKIPYILQYLHTEESFKIHNAYLQDKFKDFFDFYADSEEFVQQIKRIKTEEDLFNHYYAINRVAKSLGKVFRDAIGTRKKIKK